MELSQLQKSAKAQHETLCEIAKALRRRGNRSSRVRNSNLQSLGIVKSAPLEIDDPTACDPERRFFNPSYADEHLQHAFGADDPEYVTGIMETGRQCEGIWEEAFRPFDPDDSEWFAPCPEDLPMSRFQWFDSCLDSMQQDRLDRQIWWEDEEDRKEHESRTDGWRVAFAVKTGDSTYHVPKREERDWDYRPLSLMEPRDRAKPHLAIIMGDSKVPYKPEAMLVSEVHAAAEMSKRQLCRPSLNNHHTKPILVFTLMSETHGRITQAYFDAKIDKLVVRQSRILDLAGKRPTDDAYLLLRWMMNIPTGETEYKQDKEHKLDGDQRKVPSQPTIVVTEASPCVDEVHELR